ncbi:UNVERIFIED_CONTAM: Cysteine-rich receptor-like protein kinase [Sesamum angustifolium]|uniref:Cysteine-rich receptor-like protein kinase n=1 Tax=Sesamum angustifolium TaxID=2727405 RepID=A0AAW2Q8Q3_9LAMI
MMNESVLGPFIKISMLLVLLFANASFADPRSQTVKIMCGNQLEHNATAYVPNFIATMEKISEQMRTSGFGVAVTGSGLDTNYGLAQCYDDLSLLDCVLCYAEARSVLPQCFPASGGRIFLDGCFMRAENYSFFQEYTGRNDRTVCGNKTRKGSAFQASARRALLQAVSATWAVTAMDGLRLPCLGQPTNWLMFWPAAGSR